VPPERKQYENLTVRFSDGTLARITAALRGRENRADFIRAAIATKLAMRERKRPIEEEDVDDS